MVLKIFGSSNATCTKRVALICHEKNVPFELIEIDFKSFQHKSPEFLEKQPFGQVPYIDDDGFILYESRAICRYINAKYIEQGPHLVPTDPKALAIFEQAASVEAFNFDPYAKDALYENVYKVYFGMTPDPEKFAGHIKKLLGSLDAYDKILSKQKYLAGDEITLVDLFHLPYGALLKVAGSDVMTEKPHVARWWNDISSRKAWKTVAVPPNTLIPSP